MARTQSLAKAEQPSAFEGFGCGARRKSTYETYVGVGGEWRRHHRVARCAQITNIVNFDGSDSSDGMDVMALTALRALMALMALTAPTTHYGRFWINPSKKS